MVDHIVIVWEVETYIKCHLYELLYFYTNFTSNFHNRDSNYFSIRFMNLTKS